MQESKPCDTCDMCTVYGYPVRELVLFATACRQAGVTEADLHDYALNFEAVCQLVMDEVYKAHTEAIAKALGGYDDAGA